VAPLACLHAARATALSVSRRQSLQRPWQCPGGLLTVRDP